MSELDFPSNPPVDQIFIGTNNITYVYDGVKWNANFSDNAIWKRDIPKTTISPTIPDDKLSVQTYVLEDLELL